MKKVNYFVVIFSVIVHGNVLATKNQHVNDSWVFIQNDEIDRLIDKYRSYPGESFSKSDIDFLIEFEKNNHEDKYPWPFSGRLTNKVLVPIRGWVSDPDTFIEVPPFESTPRDLDVDFGQDTLGQWYKIGWHHLHIYPDGRAEGYSCKVPRPNMACP